MTFVVTSTTSCSSYSVFIDIHGRILTRTNNVNIGLRPNSVNQRISLEISDLDGFGSKLDLTVSPPQKSTLTISRQVPALIDFDNNNHIRGFFAPPRVMIQLHFKMMVPRHLILTARADANINTNVTDILYFYFGYIRNLQYCFEFDPLHTRENLNLANPLDGRLNCYMEAVPPDGDSPPAGVNRWIALRHEDASIGEGRSFVTGPIRTVTTIDKNGPARARG
jgi:hypothetical protein